MAGLKNVRSWRHVHPRSRFFYIGVKGSEAFLDCTGTEKSSWTVPAHFFCMQFLSHSSYLPGDKSAGIERCTQP